MSPKRPGSRNAIAGIGLAAAGMVYRRLSGRRQADPPAPAPPPAAAESEPESVDDAAVERARSELAEELARRAGRSDS
jgi:hypothetical protein